MQYSLLAPLQGVVFVLLLLEAESGAHLGGEGESQR